MNTLVRFVSAAAVLGTAFLLSGCVTNTSRSSRVKVVEEFSVVESSTEKELTPAQIADLRQAVANYLRGQGLTDGRTYYVRVTFPSDVPGEEPQWAVVRIGGQSVRTYQVIAAYPGRDDYYPDDFYRTGYSYSYANYYPGYAGFSRWGYYDPFDYNYGAYHRPVPPENHDHTKPDKPDEPGKKTDHPRDDRNRWHNTPRTDDNQPRTDHPPRTANPDRWTRDRSEPRDADSRPTSRPERTYTPPERTHTPPERSYTPPERTYTPRPESSYSPPPERPSPPPSSANSSRAPEPSRTSAQQSPEKER